MMTCVTCRQEGEVRCSESVWSVCEASAALFSSPFVEVCMEESGLFGRAHHVTLSPLGHTQHVTH